MRFGKKLALQVIDDGSGAPYLSHKPMKEAINRIVRELRLYQAASASGSGYDFAGAHGSSCPSQEELCELEQRVIVLDQELFSLVDSDLTRILDHIREGEAQLHDEVAKLQEQFMEAGLLFNEEQLRKVEKALPRAGGWNRQTLCQQLIKLRLRSEPESTARHAEELHSRYNDLVDNSNVHSQYVEINVAGFRKLLKRHEKQIPQEFRSRPTPCLEFHGLVTHSTRQLLDQVRQLGEVLADVRRQLGETTGRAGQVRELRPEPHELKGLGPECQMVLSIQKQLKDPAHGDLTQIAGSASSPAPGFLYPKPGGALGAPPGGVPAVTVQNPAAYAPVGLEHHQQQPFGRAHVQWIQAS